MATPALLPGNPPRGVFPFLLPAEQPRRAAPRTLASGQPRASVARASRAQQDQLEREQLLLKLLPLVKRLALQVRERLPLHVAVDDLISTGVLGLVDAVRKYDTSKRVKLESYARYRIRGAILDGLRGLDRASRDMRKKLKKAEMAYHTLESRLRRPPRDEEMAEALGMSLEKWFRVSRELNAVGMDWLRPMGSVGTKETKPSGEEMLAADNDGHQFDSCYRREQKEILARSLLRIPERERHVVQLYYDEQLTMKEIGQKLGIDESRVSQLHSAALARLRSRVKEIVDHPQPSASRLSW